MIFKTILQIFTCTLYIVLLRNIIKYMYDPYTYKISEDTKPYYVMWLVAVTLAYLVMMGK